MLRFAERIMHDLKLDFGWDSYFVGGMVRDKLMGLIPSADVDVEVYGTTYSALENALRLMGLRVGVVGKEFGIIKVFLDDGSAIDFSIPRRDNRVGVGHTGFECEFDPTITPEQAARRRDFTMNSVFMNVNGDIRDPYDGRKDIEQRLLRATSDAFSEDPLRVLRAMQFASRFDLKLEQDTAVMCRKMGDEFTSISVERIWMEWKKWAMGFAPSAGLRVLLAADWIRFFPEIRDLIGVLQDAEWHPEGDAWTHTCHCLDAAAEIADRDNLGEDDRLTLLFAVLLHDVGKPSTTVMIDGRWRSPGHASAGVPLAEDFLLSIGAPGWLIDRVKPLVGEHMVHVSFGDEAPSKRVIQRLAMRLEPTNVAMLRKVVRSDMEGRPPLPGGDPLADWEAAAETYAVESGRPTRILMGRHLLAEGLTPGRELGKILERAYEAQLDGEFSNLEGAMQWFMDNETN